MNRVLLLIASLALASWPGMAQIPNSLAAGGSATFAQTPTFATVNLATAVPGVADAWLMQEGTGSTFADTSGTANTVTAAGGTVLWQSGPGRLSRGALKGAHLDGVLIATAANFTNFNPTTTSSFTACAWTSFDAANNQEIIVAQLRTTGGNPGWYMQKNTGSGNSGNKPGMFLQDGGGHSISVNGNYFLYPGTLYHVCGTYSGNGLASGVGMYVDGVSQTTTTVIDALAGNQIQPAGPVTLGSWAGGTIPHTGWLGNVQLYNRVLTAAEIAMLYQSGPASNSYTSATRTSTTVYACTFATCDCNLAARTKIGGGTCTDNTAKLEAVLWTATSTNPLELIVDGGMGTTGLLVPHGGYFSIDGEGKATGFYVLPGSNYSSLDNGWGQTVPGHNGNLAAGTPPPKGSNVRISNLLLDSNKNTAGFPTTSNSNRGTGACPGMAGNNGDARGCFAATNSAPSMLGWHGGITLSNLSNVTIDHVYEYDPPSYGMFLSNVDHVWVSNHRHTATGQNTDGIHVSGPADHVTINNCQLSPNDDGIALNAPEGYAGAIDAVTVSNCEVNASGANGGFMRLYGVLNASGGPYVVSNVAISNSTANANHGILIGAGNGGSSTDMLGPIKFSHFVFTPLSSAATVAVINDAASDVSFDDLTVNGTLGTTPLIQVGATSVTGVTVSNLNLSNINVYRTAGAQTLNTLLQVISPTTVKRLALSNVSVTDAQGQSVAAMPNLIDIPTGAAVTNLFVGPLDMSHVTALLSAGSSARVTNQLTLSMLDGSAAAPSLAFGTATATGFFKSGGNIGWSGAGTLGGSMGAAGVTALGYGIMNDTNPVAHGMNIRETGAYGMSVGVGQNPDTGVSRGGAAATACVGNGTAGDCTGVLKAAAVQAGTVTTVAGLPTCNGAAEGTVRAVSDATAPTYNAALTGGAAVHTIAYCNGTAWVSH